MDWGGDRKGEGDSASQGGTRVRSPFERRSPDRLREARPGTIAFVEVVRMLVVLLAIAVGYVVGGGTFTTGTLSSQGRGPILGALIGALCGYVIGGVLGRLIKTAIVRAERGLHGSATASLIAGSIGAVAVADICAVISIPAPVLLPHSLGWIVFALAVWIGGYFGYSVGSLKAEELFAVAGLSTRPLARASAFSHNLGSELTLVDSSVVLDGRLLPLAQAGLISGTLLVPVFVLDEIQGIADAQDPVRRRRGRRGLDVLEALRAIPGVDVQVVDDEVPEQVSIDAKLVKLAKRLRVGVITVDVPMQKAAELQDVRCLNLDQVESLLRSIHIPGETLEVEITAQGREPGQGVGYLADGSMVVVTDGGSRIGQEMTVRVVNTTQTSMGTMIFATDASAQY